MYYVIGSQEEPSLMMLNYITGFGMALHHTGSSILYAFLLAGVVKVEKPVVSICIYCGLIHLCGHFAQFNKAGFYFGLVTSLTFEALLQLEIWSYIWSAPFPLDYGVGFLSRNRACTRAVQGIPRKAGGKHFFYSAIAFKTRFCSLFREVALPYPVSRQPTLCPGQVPPRVHTACLRSPPILVSARSVPRSLSHILCLGSQLFALVKYRYAFTQYLARFH